MEFCQVLVDYAQFTPRSFVATRCLDATASASMQETSSSAASIATKQARHWHRNRRPSRSYDSLIRWMVPALHHFALRLFLQCHVSAQASSPSPFLRHRRSSSYSSEGTGHLRTPYGLDTDDCCKRTCAARAGGIRRIATRYRRRCLLWTKAGGQEQERSQRTREYKCWCQVQQNSLRRSVARVRPQPLY